MSAMRLYVLPGACSLASHIALETVTDAMPSRPLSWEVVVVERGHTHDFDYTTVNPLGTVPALVSAEGRLIVESLAVLLHIADAYPETAIAPSTGSDRDRLMTLLSLMATNGHTSFQMLWRSERFADTPEGVESVERMCARRLSDLFERLESEIATDGLLIGGDPTIADMYLFGLCRWGLRLDRPTTDYPKLWRFTERLANVNPVKRAMAREGITLHGPGTGLG